MPLPNTGMSFTPFDPLPASDLNDIVENVEALADGSGLDNGAVGVTQRSGGFFIGNISAATLTGTGNKTITGVGFIPKLVVFANLPSASTTGHFSGGGAMTPTSQYTWCVGGNTTEIVRYGSTSNCIASFTDLSNATPEHLSAYVSMNADGFTINVSTGGSPGGNGISYIAYG